MIARAILGLPRRSSRARRYNTANRVPQAEEWVREHRPPSYWVVTRRPFPSLLFVAPLVLVYEVGVFWLGNSGTGGFRTGADSWMRQALATVGLTDPWFLPLLLGLILMGWQVVRSHDWRFSPAILAGMIVESLLWAAALVGISRLIDLGFSYLESPRAPVLAADRVPLNPSIATLVGYLGAGVYEETLFRLVLVPALFGLLRLMLMPRVLASSWAVTASALLFALAHHAGNAAEPFTWFVFIFRWMAGVFFAWIFVVRGFGIAVGSHAAYDILVGWIGWRI
jgi:membrane protease YdiL (CAAX protease family)